MKITLGGLSGTGTSTIGRMLAKKLNYTFMSGGNFARQLAAENGMTMEQRDKYLLETGDNSDDIKLDDMQKKFGEENQDFVLESRLAWFRVPDSVKIKLYCDDDVRFARTSKDDSNRIGTIIEDFEKTKIKTLERQEVHRLRIERLYGIKDLNADEHFDIVIDTTHVNQEEVMQKILDYIETRK